MFQEVLRELLKLQKAELVLADMHDKVAAYEAELGSLKNQEVTIRKLEERIRNMEDEVLKKSVIL